LLNIVCRTLGSYGAVEGKQLQVKEKVTVEVPRVENSFCGLVRPKVAGA
jgi:hypothetical protein